MSTRALLRLVAAAVFLLALWLGISLLPTGSDPGDPSDPDHWVTFFGRLTPDAVTAVRIGAPDGSKLLARGPEGWTIDGFPADSGSVARFWSAISDPSTPELAARNPANHARLGLEADSAVHLVFATEGDSARLLLGDPGPGRATTYIRRPESDAAYLSRRDLLGFADRSVDDWRDKRVVALDTSRVDRVAIVREDASYDISRGDSLWSVVSDSGSPGSADPGLIRSVLGGLDELPGTAFVRDETIDLSMPTRTVSALSSAGDTLALVLLGELDAEWWAMRAGSEPVLSVPAFRAEQIAPPLEAIRAVP